MILSIREMQDTVNKLIIKVKKCPAKQITQISLINGSKSIVDKYFRNFRDAIPDVSKLPSIDILDDLFQKLLVLTHKSSTKEKYIALLESLKFQLIELESQALSINPSKTTKKNFQHIDEQIIATLNKIIPTSANSYIQAILDLETAERISWRGPATDLRESLRECLDYMAPDKDVINQPGFKYEKDQTTPTMKQKVKYILKSRGKRDFEIKTTEISLNLVEELFGSFVRSVYTRANVSTHTETTKKEVLKLLGMIRVIFSEILELD